MTTGTPTIRTALRAALAQGIKQRDRLATGTYRIALAAIDDAEAVPVGKDDRAGAIEFSVLGVGRTEAQRRTLTEQDMILIVRKEEHALCAAADVLAAHNRTLEADLLHRQAGLLRALLDRPSPGP